MTRFVRACGLAAIIGGVFIVLARVFEVALFDSSPLSAQAVSPNFVPFVGLTGLIGTIGFLFGVVGLYVRHADCTGWWGLAAFAVAFIGLLLTSGVHWMYAFVSPLLAELAPVLLDTSLTDPAWGALAPAFGVSYGWGFLGWVVMAILVIAAAVLPRWVGLVMLVSMVLASVLPVSIHSLPAIGINLLLAAGPVAFGYALWAQLGADKV